MGSPAEEQNVPFLVEEADALVLLRCQALLQVPGVVHAFSTRRADAETEFDMGGIGPPDPARDARRARFLRAAGFGGATPALLRQVHGARIVRAGGAGVPEEADGLIWLRGASPRTVPCVRFADCVAILLVDREGAAAAAVHAGWRGTAAGIAARAVEELGVHGVPPGRLLAALGPAILPCCYTVGREVAEAVWRASGVPPGRSEAGENGVRLDLHHANRMQLRRAGVPQEAIHAAPWCTACRGDLFYSHRREGGATGRMMASVGSAS